MHIPGAEGIEGASELTKRQFLHQRWAGSRRQRASVESSAWKGREIAEPRGCLVGTLGDDGVQEGQESP